MRELVAKYVDEAMDALLISDELKKFLKNHGRKQVLIDNLTREMKAVENSAFKHKLTNEKIRETIVDFVGMFMKLAKTEADAHQKKSTISLMAQFKKNFGKKESEIKDDLNVRIISL